MKLTKSEAGRLGGVVWGQIAKTNRTIRMASYQESPKRCLECRGPIDYDKKRNDFCSQSCGASFHNRGKCRNQRKIERLSHCLSCSSPIVIPQTRYCCHQCHNQHRYDVFIARWKAGLESGYKPANGMLSAHLRRYLIETRGEKCEVCGWCEVNPVTGRVPITIDHIDGRWQNTAEDNLRILCPNHHALTATFAALNRGNAHPHRRLGYLPRAKRQRDRNGNDPVS